jgi:hypothetical protein
MGDWPTILCGVDDSRHALAAARVADELATWLGARAALAGSPKGGRSARRRRGAGYTARQDDDGTGGGADELA